MLKTLPMTDNKECACCISQFDKAAHKAVECPHCNYNTCKQCVRSYILGTINIPNCMNCHKPFEQEFMVVNLNRTWVMKDYKNHRKELLFEREYSKLVDTMPKIAAHKKITELTIRKSNVTKQISELKQTMVALQSKQYKITVKINLLKNGEDSDEEKKKFIMACPSDGCRGYLSSVYKCELCNLYTCPHCREIIGFHKDNPEHVCNEDNVKSTELIKKETKGCPTCGTRIFKIDGCDQMWCIECKVAFSWKTGKIDKGVVHNPHFYQWHRTNGTIQRNPGDNPCGGLPPWWQFRQIFIRQLNNAGVTNEDIGLPPRHPMGRAVGHVKPENYNNCGSCNDYIEAFGSLHRTISHIQNVTLVDCRRKIEDNQDHEDIRVSYLLDEIDKDEMAIRIYRKEGVARKEIELSHIYELLCSCGTDLFKVLHDEVISDVSRGASLDKVDNMTNAAAIITSINIIFHRRLDEMRKLIDYCNNRFGIISGVYSFKAPYIDDVFVLTKQKKIDVKGLHTMVSTEMENKTNTLYPNAEGAV